MLEPSAACWLEPRAICGVVPVLLVEGEDLKSREIVVAKVGESPNKVMDVLGPPVTEWSEEAYVEAWHYNLGTRRLRVDISPQGFIENFILADSDSTRFFPPDELMR